MLKQLEGGDWEEAFKYANPDPVIGCPVLNTRFEREDVARIEGVVEGENDGASWIIYGKLKDGRWFMLSAWCDYTGWGCREDGSSKVSLTKKQIIELGMTKEDRERFGLPEPTERATKRSAKQVLTDWLGATATFKPTDATEMKKLGELRENTQKIIERFK